jgi:hypothetical protein
LTARTLKIEIDPAATALRLKPAEDGSSILVVPSSKADIVSGRAREIARKVEHENGTVADVERIIADAPAQSMRLRTAVLGETNFNIRSIGCSVGCADVVDNSVLKPTLTSFLEADTTYSASLMRDADGYLVAARRNGDAVVCCDRFLDTASVHDFVEKSGRKGDVLIYGESDGYVDALVASVSEGDLQPLAKSLGDRVSAVAVGNGGKIPPKPPGAAAVGGDDGGFHFFRSGGGKGGGSGGAGGGKGGGHGPRDVRLEIVIGEKNAVRQAASKPRDLNNAMSTRYIEGAEAKGLLSELDAAHQRTFGDAEPFVVSQRFPDEGRNFVDFAIAAGFKPDRVSAGKSALKEAVDQARSENPRDSLARFYARVKEKINDKMKRGEIEWLRSFINLRDLKFRFTNNEERQRFVKGS